MENAKVVIDIAIAILTGLSVAIPLMISLINYIKKLYKEKRWNELIKLTLEHMVVAEQKYSDGADKKTLAMALVEKSAKEIGYDLDTESESKISELIDAITDAAKKINVKIDETKEEVNG